jgi:hypothetical protein
VRDGTFEDSLRVGSTTLSIPPLIVTMVGADERAGTYVLQLEAEGYQPWDTPILDGQVASSPRGVFSTGFQ